MKHLTSYLNLATLAVLVSLAPRAHGLGTDRTKARETAAKIEKQAATLGEYGQSTVATQKALLTYFLAPCTNPLLVAGKYAQYKVKRLVTRPYEKAVAGLQVGLQAGEAAAIAAGKEKQFGETLARGNRARQQAWEVAEQEAKELYDAYSKDQGKLAQAGHQALQSEAFQKAKASLGLISGVAQSPCELTRQVVLPKEGEIQAGDTLLAQLLAHLLDFHEKGNRFEAALDSISEKMEEQGTQQLVDRDSFRKETVKFTVDASKSLGLFEERIRRLETFAAKFRDASATADKAFGAPAPAGGSPEEQQAAGLIRRQMETAKQNRKAALEQLEKHVELSRRELKDLEQLLTAANEIVQGLVK